MGSGWGSKIPTFKLTLQQNVQQQGALDVVVAKRRQRECVTVGIMLARSDTHFVLRREAEYRCKT